MGLLKNLRLLFSDSLLTRMGQLENRQDLLEEWTQARLDSVKAYSARVAKRERDEAAREPRTGQRQPTIPGLSPAALKVLERRQRRHGTT